MISNKKLEEGIVHRQKKKYTHLFTSFLKDNTTILKYEYTFESKLLMSLIN